jgi:hypothetical protein
MTRNSEGLETHTQSLKHLDSSIKCLQAELEEGYNIGIRIANLDVLRGLKNLGVTLNGMATSGNLNRGRIWRMEEQLHARTH